MGCCPVHARVTSSKSNLFLLCTCIHVYIQVFITSLYCYCTAQDQSHLIQNSCSAIILIKSEIPHSTDKKVWSGYKKPSNMYIMTGWFLIRIHQPILINQPISGYCKMSHYPTSKSLIQKYTLQECMEEANKCMTDARIRCIRTALDSSH